MSVCILEDEENGYKCLYCSTTMWAFGAIFYPDEDVKDFLDWLKIDARRLSDKEFDDKVSEWRRLAPTRAKGVEYGTPQWLL